MKDPITDKVLKDLRFKRQTLENMILRDVERRIEAFEKETGVTVDRVSLTTNIIDASDHSETIVFRKLIPEVIIKI